MRLVFLGPPGAGKGTQAVRVAERLSIPAISTGDIFRSNVREGTELGRLAQQYMDKGEYVPDEVTNDMVADRLAQADAAGGFLLDGYPRTTAQLEVLDRLLKLGIQAQTFAALCIVPLIEVAWADGALDAKERRAVLEHAGAAGITSGSPAYGLLEAWLEHRPSQQLLDAWRDLVRAIREQIGAEEAGRLKAEIVERARVVARASGGVLGLGSKVSRAEAAMLASLERPFETQR